MEIRRRKYIDRDWLEERIAIKLEHLPRPTPKQEHDALNATVRELQAQWGELDIPQWPRTFGG